MGSQAEEQQAWYQGFMRIVHGITIGISCFYIAQVVKYKKETHTADIKPLANLSDGQESAQILDVPVTEQCYILDEIIERYKPELEKLDANSKLPDHKETKLVNKLPKKKYMRKGVPVVVAVLDRDNDNWAGGRDASSYTPNTGRIHDQNDSIIIGILGGDPENG